MSDPKTILESQVSRKNFLAGLGLGAAALATASAGDVVRAAGLAAKPTIKLGDKGFTEEYIVADMYQLLLEHHGFNVQRHSFGTVAIAQNAIVHGSIDMYPEYTGTGYLEVLGLKNPPPNALKLYRVVKKQYKKKFNLIWLEQSPMNDTNAVALKHDTAAKHNIHTMSDLAKVANQLTFAGLAECVGRADCLVGLKNTYGITFKKVLTFSSPALNYKALLGGQADVSEVFSTDPQIAAYNLTVPVDNKHLWPPYHIAPVVRQDLLKAHPEIFKILNHLAPKITSHAISALNAKVDLHHQDHMAVARGFLKSHGMI